MQLISRASAPIARLSSLRSPRSLGVPTSLWCQISAGAVIQAPGGKLRCLSTGAQTYQRVNPHREQRIESRLRTKDGLSDDSRLIYNMHMTRYLTAALYGIPVSAVVGAAGLLYNLNFEVNSVWIASLDVLENFDMLLFSGLMFLHTVSLSYIVTRTPLRIYYSEERDIFEAVIYRLGINTRRIVTLRPGELIKDSSNNSIIKGDVYRLKSSGRRWFLLGKCFKTNFHLLKLLGEISGVNRGADEDDDYY